MIEITPISSFVSTLLDHIPIVGFYFVYLLSLKVNDLFDKNTTVNI